MIYPRAIHSLSFAMAPKFAGKVTFKVQEPDPARTQSPVPKLSPSFTDVKNLLFLWAKRETSLVRDNNDSDGTLVLYDVSKKGTEPLVVLEIPRAEKENAFKVQSEIGDIKHTSGKEVKGVRVQVSELEPAEEADGTYYVLRTGKDVPEGEGNPWATSLSSKKLQIRWDQDTPNG